MQTAKEVEGTEEAALSLSAELDTPVQLYSCPVCRGTGIHPDGFECHVCLGTGQWGV